MSEEEAVEGAPLSVWIGLILISLVSFWSQATVTEERLVPALNVVADYYGMPDDIAGATLMAAGASSPELFSSIVALFITHSSLGLGTIVGSEIFNQLVICAGAVYASKTGKLQLNKAIVTREVGFYGLGIVLLYVVLQDVRPVEDDDVDHIFISFADACMVFAGYLAYVAVCANMKKIVACFGKQRRDAQHRQTSYGAIAPATQRAVSSNIEGVEDLPFVTDKKSLSSEPASNWAPVSYYLAASTEHGADEQNISSRSLSSRGSFLASSIRQSMAQARTSILVDMFQHTESPAATHDLYALEENEYAMELSCFMWQRSYFYSKAYYGAHAWHLRWFDFTLEKISSIPNRKNPEQHSMTYPKKFHRVEMDEERLIVRIINPNPKKRDYIIMAPSPAIFQKVIQYLEDYMEYNSKEGEDSSPEEQDTTEGDADGHMDLIEFPSEGSNIEIIFWILLSPLRFLMHYTVPDVRQLTESGESKATIGLASFSTFMCLVWLIVGSYAMVASLEALAELLDIPDAVIGVTVSAAGTSLPNYVASKVAAQNGFGNQAVSNAFGSNSFNIMVGLGLPWVLYTSFGTGFEPYHGLRNENISQSIVILAAILAIFVGLMLQTGFVIYKWHGTLFIGLYVAYLAFAIGQVYLG